MTTHSNIPGITKISIVECNALQQNLEWKCIADIPIGISTDTKPICFSGIPTCEAVTTCLKNDESEKTTLKFNSTVDIPTSIPVAFIITDAQKKSFIIGAKEKPFPIISKTKRTGSPEGDSSIISYEVTRESLKSLIPVVI